MKIIHLIRHAKSSWDLPELDDSERLLSSRGLKDCRLMAKPILFSPCSFQHVYSSSAIRALLTITLITLELEPKEIYCQEDDALYCFEHHSLLQWLAQLDDAIDEVVLIGHNPAFTDLCNALSGESIDKIPTCGYVKLRSVDCTQWRDVADSAFNLDLFLSPKKVKKLGLHLI